MIPFTAIQRAAGAGVRTLFGATLVAQLACTALGVSHWPLMPYDFFAHVPTQTARHVRFVVEQAGLAPVDVEPAHLVPLEFFKAAPYVDAGLLDAEDDAARAAFVFALVDQAQARPWRHFDETWASWHATAPVTGIDVVLDEQDMQTGATTRSVIYHFARSAS